MRKLGQGTSHLGSAQTEEEALRIGIELGMRLIDTAEIYGCEELVGRAIAGRRERVYLVSKVWYENVAGDGIARACEASLKRLATGYLDLYLLHWPTGITDFAPIVEAFERLGGDGKIQGWGVSNFSVAQMEALFQTTNGSNCITNQVPYSLFDRGIERDLLPWCKAHNVTVMAYSPLGGPDSQLLCDPTLVRIADKRGCSASAVALAWTMYSGGVVPIPKAKSILHVAQNAVSQFISLTAEEKQELDMVRS